MWYYRSGAPKVIAEFCCPNCCFAMFALLSVETASARTSVAALGFKRGSIEMVDRFGKYFLPKFFSSG
jgi:hypothetical protein